MSENQNPEQKARDTIDALLKQAGWIVQSAKKIDLNAGLGIAVREYQTDVGPADYALFVDKKALGIVEAKKEDLGHKITEVESQTTSAAASVPHFASGLAGLGGLPPNSQKGGLGGICRGTSKPKVPKPLLPLTVEELAELPELPEEWVWSKLGDFIVSIDAGKSFKCDEREPHVNEIGVAKVSAVTWGEYDESESKTCTDTNKENEAYLIRSGDFILSRANTIDLVGACVIARKVTKRIMLSDKTLRIVFDGFQQEYFLQYLGSRIGRKQIMRLSTGNQESMRNIGQDRIRSIAVPICSGIEAEAVMEALASMLSEVDQLELTITTSLQQSEALRQSILKKAFSGQLVPQDPHDEPASALLARIRADQAVSAKDAPTAAKTRTTVGRK